MIRRFVLITAVVLAGLAPSAAYAEEGNLEITSAELISESGVSETLVVKGTGQCAAAGPVSIRVIVRDVETGGRGIGTASTECLAPGERILWSVQVLARDTRAGDRVAVSANAAGAITASDQKTVMLQWQ
jgi:hypothetical protein